MKPSLKQKLWQAAPWLWMAAGYLYMLWYHIVPGAWIIDSDLAGEMVLADLLNREGGILTTNWFYTTELRVFHMQWFYRLGLLLFPHDWHAARVLAMALVLALLAAASLFFTRAAGMGSAGVWCTAALLWPFGFWYLFLCLYGGYYLIYILFSLVSFGIVLHLGRDMPHRQAPFWLAAGSLLGLMSGLNGVRQLMVFYVPLLLAMFLVLVCRIRTGRADTLRAALREQRPAGRMLGGTLLFALCSGAGYLVNMGILSRSHKYESFSDMVWQSAPESLLKVWGDYLRLFGYQQGARLFSFAGIAGGLGLLLAIAIPFSFVQICRRFSRLTLPQQAAAVFSVCVLAVCGVVFTHLGLYGDQYWLPALPFGLVVLLLALKTESFRFPAVRPVLVCGFAMCISLCSAATVQREISAPLRGRAGLDTVTDWLVDQGYTGGYAWFWTSQVVTELSDGQLEMWTVSYAGDGIYPWLQQKDHFWRQPDAPCFMLFDLQAGEDPAKFGGREVYRDEGFAVTEFANSSTVQQAMEALQAGTPGG